MGMHKETENVFDEQLSGHQVGAISLEINTAHAKVSLVTEGDRRRARVRVFTRSTDLAVQQAVTLSQIQLVDGILTVYVPNISRSSSNVAVQNTGNAVAYGNGSVAVTGVVMGAMVNGVVFNNFGSGNVVNSVQDTHGVEVEIDLGARNVDAKLSHSSLIVVGPLDLLKAKISHSSLSTEVVDRLFVEASHSNIKAGMVTGQLDVQAAHCNVKVPKYRGQQAKINASHGTVNFGVNRAASGDLNITANHGTITVTGSEANPGVWVSTKASHGVVSVS